MFCEYGSFDERDRWEKWDDYFLEVLAFGILVYWI